MPKWRNWYTRTTQNRVGLRPWGFDSPLRHHLIMNILENDIELELRAEVSKKQLKDLFVILEKDSRQISHNRRLSAMFLGDINGSKYDLRVRIDSLGKVEVVAKKGAFHAHDRTEVFQPITKEDFLGFVKIFSLFGFNNSKITERENFNFDLGNGIMLVIVKTKDLSYVEIEKISNKNNLENNRLELLKKLENFKLKPLDDKGYYDLCDRLTDHEDWIFTGSNKDVTRLKDLLNNY